MTRRLAAAIVAVSLAPIALPTALVTTGAIHPHSVEHPPARVVDWSH
jgi:hypothetical protein